MDVQEDLRLKKEKLKEQLEAENARVVLQLQVKANLHPVQRAVTELW